MLLGRLVAGLKGVGGSCWSKALLSWGRLSPYCTVHLHSMLNIKMLNWSFVNSGTTAYVEQSTPYPQDGKQVSRVNISRNYNCFFLLGITTASQLSFFVDITMAVTINAGRLSFPYCTLHGLDFMLYANQFEEFFGSFNLNYFNQCC